MADQTKAQILTAAEKLFAEKGFAGVGVREITQLADVNIASISYHFGSKEELYLEMVRRYVEPVNQQRLELLAETMAAQPTAQSIFAALFNPMMELFSQPKGEPNPVRIRLAARVFVDLADSVTDFQERLFKEVKQKFFAALTAACPEVPPEHVPRRFYLAIALMGGAFVQLSEQCRRNPGRMGRAEIRAAFDDLARFAAAGFSAPLPTTRS